MTRSFPPVCLLLTTIFLSVEGCLQKNPDDTNADTDTDKGADCYPDADTDTDADCDSGAVSDHEGITMAHICPGTFMMGSPSCEVGRPEDWLGNENQHKVTLTGAYWMGVYEVTQAQFESFMGYQPSYFADCADCPAENMGWFEAAAFANAVSDAAGLWQCYSCSGSEDSVVCRNSGSPYTCEGYRLPTEAEWEHAARAGTTSAFSNGGNLYHGDEEYCDRNLLLDNGEYLNDIAVYGSNHPDTVGTKEPNSWGLYDIHGNIWEWCHDVWGGSDYPDDDEIDPEGEGLSGPYRSFRGGSWLDCPPNLRSAVRDNSSPDDDWGNVGFRLARSE